MKKIFIIFFLSSVFASSVYAQDYRKFKVGLGVGDAINYAYRGNRNIFPGGAMITIEPGHRINDNLSIALRIEGVVLFFGNIDENVGILSFTNNCQYYFGSSGKPFRPYAGAGLGIYELGSTESQFGFYPRLGFDLGHFGIALDYNFLPEKKIGNYYIERYNYSYLSIRIGVFFGRGKKEIQLDSCFAPTTQIQPKGKTKSVQSPTL